jgi:hypothetical protein
MKKEIKTEKKDLKNILVQLEEKLVEISDKLPKLPDSLGEFLVKYGPYLIIISLVIGVFGLLASFGLMAAVSPIAVATYGYGAHFSLYGLVGLISMVLMAIAIPGLLKRAKSAWNLIFYSSLITAVSYLIDMNLGSLIIGTAINWYFLFQIRKFYK